MYRWKRLFADIYSLSGWTGWLLCAGIWVLITASSLTACSGSLYTIDTVWLLGMGGVAPVGSLDLMGLFRWFGALFPCMVINLLYFYRERTARLTYVLPRLCSLGLWWRRLLRTMTVWCYAYAWSGLLILSVGYWLFPSECPGKFGDILQPFFYLLLAYPAGLAVMSISVAIIGMVLNQKVGMFFFVLVYGLSAVVGSRLTSFSLILPGCYAMYNQVDSLPYGKWGVFLIMLAVLGAFFLVGKPIMRFSLNQSKSY